MQFIKRFGKQLAFVVLMGSAMFFASSASAVIRTRVAINTDLFIDADHLRLRFPGATELDLIKIGGNHYSDPSGRNGLISFQGATVYDPFNNVYANNLAVGGSLFTSNVQTNGGSNPSFKITGVFTEVQASNKPNNGILTFGLTSTAANPPALRNGQNTNYGSCLFQECVVFHYGYLIDVDTNRVINPYFLGSFFEVRDKRLTGNLFVESQMASPEIDLNSPAQEDTPKEFLVVYSEQINPEQPGVVIVNWTEFQVNRGQTPTLRFTNSESTFDPVTVSNTRVLRSATEIPLAQLNAIDLPPTDSNGFVSVPGADGTVAPGEIKTPVEVPPSPPIGTGTVVLDRLRPFNGTSDFVEIADNENLNFGTGDLSISAWVRTTSTNGIEVILDKRVETTGPIQGYSLVNFNGSLLLQLADAVGNEFTNYISNISIADGNLHHVTVTVDRDQPDGGRWYLDGVEVVGERFNPTRRGSLSNSKPLFIGRRSDSPDAPGFFNGEIGPVRLDKRVLSPQEIEAIAANRP